MDDVVLNKVATIERCLSRINEEFQSEEEFKASFTKQDSVILNLQRACEAAIDISNRIIRIQQYEIPQSARDVFRQLESKHVISSELSENMQKMVGLRNIAVHDYQKLNMDIIIAVVKHQLEDFQDFIKQAIQFLSKQ